MARKTNEELQAIKKRYGVNRLWSWSGVNTYLTSPYEYYLKRIEPTPEDRANSIYVYTGGLTHDILEKLYLEQIEFEEMPELFEDGWCTFEIADLKFNRSDADKNNLIKIKYVEDLRHFFKNYRKLPCKVEIERFITIKIRDYILQGYIDMIYKDEEGCYIIHDHKTSSIYKGKKALGECGQLVVYAMGIHQLGISYEKIKICWDFLKYTLVTIEQANGNKKDREIERSQIGEKLQSNAKMWLKKLGYEDSIDDYLSLLLETNDIRCLPKEVQEKYSFDNCRVFVSLTDELIQKWENRISETLDEITKKEEEYKKNKDEHLFWDTDESIKAQEYYLSNLCSYSPYKHKPFGDYLKRKDLDTGHSKKIDTDDDLSWLNDL